LSSKDCYKIDKLDELGIQWLSTSWRVDSDYFKFENPISTSTFKNDILAMKPERNSPFNKNGHGKMGLFFAANQKMFDFILEKTIQIASEDETTSFQKFIAMRVVDLDVSINTSDYTNDYTIR